RLVVERAGFTRPIFARIGIVHQEDDVLIDTAADPARAFLAYDGCEILALAQPLRLFLVEPNAQHVLSGLRLLALVRARERHEAHHRPSRGIGRADLDEETGLLRFAGEHRLLGRRVVPFGRVLRALLLASIRLEGL